MKIKSASIFAKSEVGNFDLYHDNSGFTLVQNGEEYQIENHALDRILRNVNYKRLKKLRKLGYIEVKKNYENKFSLAYSPRIKAGGAGGATAGFWLGKLLVHGAAQTVYAVAAGVTGIVCPPAAPVVWYTLQATFAAPVEAASNVVGIGLGITGGVATGPV